MRSTTPKKLTIFSRNIIITVYILGLKPDSAKGHMLSIIRSL